MYSRAELLQDGTCLVDRETPSWNGSIVRWITVTQSKCLPNERKHSFINITRTDHVWTSTGVMPRRNKKRRRKFFIQEVLQLGFELRAVWPKGHRASQGYPVGYPCRHVETDSLSSTTTRAPNAPQLPLGFGRIAATLSHKSRTSYQYLEQ